MSEVDGTVAKSSGRGLMLAPPSRQPKRKREQKVLDEDDWTDKLEAIIQRDYFPDIPKLESELEWLEVNDPY
jgi:protein DGCR14